MKIGGSQAGTQVHAARRDTTDSRPDTTDTRPDTSDVTTDTPTIRDSPGQRGDAVQDAAEGAREAQRLQRLLRPKTEDATATMLHPDAALVPAFVTGGAVPISLPGSGHDEQPTERVAREQAALTQQDSFDSTIDGIIRGMYYEQDRIRHAQDRLTALDTSRNQIRDVIAASGAIDRFNRAQGLVERPGWFSWNDDPDGNIDVDYVLNHDLDSFDHWVDKQHDPAAAEAIRPLRPILESWRKVDAAYQEQLDFIETLQGYGYTI